MLALATTFARPADAGALAPEAVLARARALLDRAAAPVGSGLVLDAHLDAERLAELVPLLIARHDELPVVALEDGSGLVGAAALAALDREESRTAVARAEATLRRAAAVGARLVVLRLGWVEGARRDWTHARDRFLRRALDATLVQRMKAARDAVAHVHLDRARAALDRLCRSADELGITLLLKNGQRYVELPSPRELGLLRADFAGAPLRSLFDLPAAHLGDAMGFQPIAITKAAFSGGPLVYSGDACGAVAALPPGRGELGRAAIEEHLAGAPARCFRPWPALTDEEIARGLHA